MTALERSMLLPALLAFGFVLAFSVQPSSAQSNPPQKLVPFPEDANDPPAAPAKPAPPKSEFKPRFRSPGVKQAQHLESGASDSGVTQASASEPILPGTDQSAESATETSKPADPTKPAEAAKQPVAEQPLPAASAEQPADEGNYYTPAATKAEGRKALDEAFTKSKTASTEEDYTAIIAMCEQGKKGGVSEAYQQYSDQLMGWSYNRRGEVRAKKGLDADALADFEAAVRLSGAWRAIHNRGVSYASAGQLDKAMADFDRTIELNPRYPNAYFNRAELRYRMAEYPAAVEDYSQAIELGKPDAATYNGRGHALYRLKKFGDALRDYGEAIKLDPTQSEPLVNRGDTHSDLGQYGEAAEDYRAAIKADPNSGRAYQAAAWLMATCPDAHYRDDKLAISAAKRAVELDGPTYRNLSTLAAAQASAGMFKEAQQSQEKAIAVAPKDQVATGEKMMALYQRDVAFRDRPLTAYDKPEEMIESEVRQATAVEPFSGPPRSNQANYQAPPQRQARQPGMLPQQPRQYQWDGPQAMPPRGQYQQPPRQMPQQQMPRARLFSPRGGI